MVKEFLSQKGIGFQERDVSRNPAYARELVNNTGQMGVPVTIISQQAVIGFDRSRLEQSLTSTPGGQRPSFGASIADASKVMAKQGSGITLGAYIGRVRPGSVAERLRLARSSGVERLHAHMCRHTFAMNYLLNGGDIFSLREILGHTTLDMGNYYLHFTSSQITAQHHKYSPIDKLNKDNSL